MNLFSERRILSVSQLTNLVQGVLEENFEHVWVEGEVSNVATPASGHLYFTLKDAGAMIRCVMFRAAARAVRFRLADGMRIILRGRVTVYPQRGEYQVLCEYLEPQGVGALQMAFQQLKEKLAREGLFAEDRKKPLPLLPQRIGIVTSPTGAAIHDMLTVINRRFANVQILLRPVRVQGEGAAEEIAAALADFNRFREVDVVIVARGGGSLEDLWAFNEEIVARAIARSKLPVITAIGHEVDFSIADLVADLRAPTPSAAAELVVQSKDQLMADCQNLSRRLTAAMERRLGNGRAQVLMLQRGLKGPEQVLGHLLQRIDDLQERGAAALQAGLSRQRSRLAAATSELRFYSPLVRMERNREYLLNLRTRVSQAMAKRFEEWQIAAALLNGRLQALSPLATLGRGYAIALKLPQLQAVKGIGRLSPGDRLRLIFADGCGEATLESVRPGTPGQPADNGSS